MNINFEYYFKKYNIIKYNKHLFILFMFVIIIFLIKLYYYNINEYFDSIPSNNIIIIKKNQDLITNYINYNHDLKYYMNSKNEYFVKDTNKPYASFITNLNRNATYYQTKMKLIHYPLKIRIANDGYYIDYTINGNIVPNKVMDVTWDDFDPYPSKAIVTIYKYDQDFLNTLKDILKKYKHLEFQMSDNKLDILYDKYMSLDIVNKFIKNNNNDVILKKNNINDKQIEETVNIVKQNLNKADTEKVQSILNTLLNSDQLDTIIKSNQVQNITKTNNLSEITDSILSNNIQISIESRDERFLFVYNKDDTEALTQLLNLFKFIYDKENLDYLSDKNTKNLRYFKIPINVMRIIIKFKQYLGIF